MPPMKSDIPADVSNVRLDLSDWVWHFVNVDGKEIETLRAIVASGHLLGGVDKYCLEPCVCFTEMPLPEAVRQRSVLTAANYKRLSGYGIGFRKAWVFTKGGLPVIYQPAALRNKLPRDMQWRHCDFDLAKGLDFSWQREWRVPGAQLTFTKSDDPTFVVPTWQEAGEHFLEYLYVDPVRDEEYAEFSWPVISHDSLVDATQPAVIEALRFD